MNTEQMEMSLSEARAVAVAYHPAPKVNEYHRLGVWFLVLSLMISALIFVGGIVRISGSGLSIPEWPLINGSLLPPISEADWQVVYKTYYRDIHGLEITGSNDNATPAKLLTLGRFRLMFVIEYSHRLLAALVSLVFLVLLTQIFRDPSLRETFGWRVGGIALILLVQALVGGIVVKYDLRAEFVAVHLGLAMALFALVFWLALKLLLPPAGLMHERQTLPFRLSMMALVLIYAQIVSGGMVAGLHAGHIYNSWPLMDGALIPPLDLLWSSLYQPALTNLVSNPVLIQFIHRWFAVVAVAAVFTLLLVSISRAVSLRARLALRSLGFVVVLQFMLGIMTLIAKVPALLAITHLMMGLILFANLIWLTFELKYHHADQN